MKRPLKLQKLKAEFYSGAGLIVAYIFAGYRDTLLLNKINEIFISMHFS